MLARLFVLLLGYFFLIFLIARVFEISSTWLKAGCLASQLLNPFALSVKKLKSILEQRGVSYSGMVEKQDLVELVEACGGITEAESCSVDPESSTEIKEVSEDLSFSGASHFFEEVEDTKAGTWLVDVIPKGRSSLLRKNQWQLLKRKISRFGIRIGTFNCQNDLRLCVKYGWDKPALIISMPKGNLPKGNVILKTYDSKPSVELVFQWISKELSSKITTFNNVKSFIDTFKAKTIDDPTYIVLFSELPHPPMLLGSLSVHFTGRVRFGHVQMSLSDWKTQKYILKEYKINNYFQSVVVFTPEGSWTYGRRKGERLEYGYLELFLRTFHPEVNDVFVTVLVMVNMSCVMELFLMNGGILKRTIHFVWLLTFYNTSLIMLCLPVLALFQLPFLNPVLSFTLKCCRYIMTSDAAALLREYTMCGLQHKGLVFGGYAIYGLLMRLIQNRLKYHFGVEDEDNTMMSAREWFTQDLNYLSNVVDSFPSLRQPQIDYSASGLEDGIELLIRRLAVPELWLRPLIPTDYINKLPVWKFCCSHSKRCCNSRQMTHTCHDSLKLAGMFVAQECAICLEEFRQGCLLLGLPCGHCYHQHCIKEWLCDGSSRSHYCCPVCRWPAYKQKPPVFGERGLHTQIEAF